MLKEEGDVGFDWHLGNLKKLLESSEKLTSSFFWDKGSGLSGFSRWRLQLNIPSCKKKNQKIGLFAINEDSCVFQGRTLKVTLSIVGFSKEKVFCRSKFVMKIVAERLYGFSQFISIGELKRLNLKDVVFNCEFKELETKVEIFKPLLNNDMFSDLELRFQTDTIPAHKIVLATFSPVFRRLFVSYDALTFLKIEDVEAKVFNEILRFMYTGTVENMNKLCHKIYVTALQYEMFKLAISCEEFLKGNLKRENLIEILQFLFTNNFYLTQTECLPYFLTRFITENIGLVLTSGVCDGLPERKPRFILDILIDLCCLVKELKWEEVIKFNFSFADKVALQPQIEYETFFNSDILSDIKIEVDSQEYFAHKLILAAKSIVFRRMFVLDKSETSGLIKIEKINSEIFLEVLRFMYLNKANDLEKIVEDLLVVANLYEIEDLMTVCENELLKRLSNDNVIRLLSFAADQNAKFLRKKCLEFIVDYLCNLDLKGLWSKENFCYQLEEFRPCFILEVLNTFIELLKASAPNILSDTRPFIHF